MATYNLSNQKYSISVDSKGAELTSLLANGREYIWSGNPEWWGKHSPLLFPIIGRVPNGEYSWRGKTYAMTKHGFARDQIFKLVKESRDCLTFQLRNEDLPSDARAWISENYPFNFVVTVIFHLGESGLTVSWEVENVGKDHLPFSIGAHPAFVFPSDRQDINVDAMMIDFKSPITLERLLLNENGLRSGVTKNIVEQDSQLALSSEMFKEDCIQFRLSSLNALTLRNSVNSDSIRLRFHGFTHFGIWTPYKKGESSPFLCLEPWYGNDSSVFDDGSFENKEGIIILNPGTAFKTHYSLEVTQ